MKLYFVKPNNQTAEIKITSHGTIIIPRICEAVILEEKTHFVKMVIHDMDAQEIRIILE